MKVPCQHHYCDGCLNSLFRLAMNDEDSYPPRCCTQLIPLDDVRLFLNARLVTDFETKKEELDDAKPTYCCVPACSTYISQEHKRENVGTCPECAAETCLLCKEAAHDGDCTVNEADQQLLELATEEGWKRCPRCRRMVELNTGCNHMT